MVESGINNSFYRFLYPMICGNMSGIWGHFLWSLNAFFRYIPFFLWYYACFLPSLGTLSICLLAIPRGHRDIFNQTVFNSKSHSWKWRSKTGKGCSKTGKNVLKQENDVLKHENEVLKQENDVLKQEIWSFFFEIF